MTLVDDSLDFMELSLDDWVEHMSALSRAERKRLLPLLRQQRSQDLAERRKLRSWNSRLDERIDRTADSITTCLTAPREIATRLPRAEWLYYVTEVLFNHDEDFLPQVYEYLLEDLLSPDSTGSSWWPMERLRVHLGRPRPNTQQYAVELADVLNGYREGSVLKAINASPDVIELIPTMLSNPDFYFRLGERAPEHWTSAIAELLIDGRLDRAEIIKVILEGQLTHSGTAHLQALSQVLDGV